MPDLTFIIPIAPHHDDVVGRAVASIEAQTVKAASIVIRDADKHGAGWARNRGLSLCQTPFVSFLDADDWLEPAFTERMLAAFRRDRYLYCDWYQGDKVVQAPDCAWVDKTWHGITSLIPAHWVKTVGGFDETLPGGEDTDLFLKLVTGGFCGRRLPEPLFHYSPAGQRSKAFVESADYHPTMQLFTQRYGGKAMACCGETVIGQQVPIGQQQDGDVLAEAQWHGNRPEVGRVTGRIYRAGWGKQVWVHPDDVKASPDRWKPVDTAPTPPADDDFALAVQMLALEPEMMGLARRMGVRMPPPVTPVPEANGKPDVARIVERARKAFAQGKSAV